MIRKNRLNTILRRHGKYSIPDKRYEQELIKKKKEIEAILSSIADGIYVYDRQGRVILTNKAANEIMGYIQSDLDNTMKERLININVFDESGRKLTPEEMPAFRAAFHAETNKGQVFRVKGRGQEHWIIISAAPIFIAGKHTGAVISMKDITKTKKAENALKESEERFRTLADNIAQLVWISDKTGKPIWFSQKWYEFSGYPVETFLEAGSSKIIFLPDNYEKISADFYNHIKKGEPWESIYQMKNKFGEYRWFLSRALPIFNKDKEIIRWFGTATDITEQKKLQEELHLSIKEREVLLKEVYHRTKNNMQVISSLMSLKSVMTKSKDIKIIFNEMQSRIRSIALVHEKLYRSENLAIINLSEYIIDLAQLIIYGSSDKKIEFRHDLEEVTVDLDTAVPCGLVITEIILNSIKYAFPESNTGYVEIKLRQQQNQMIELRICDNGIGFAGLEPKEEEATLGFQLITNIIEGQLNGSAKVVKNNGTNWILYFKNNLT